MKRLFAVIGPVARAEAADPPAVETDVGRVAAFALCASIGLLSIAIGQHGGHQDAGWAPWLFWGGVVVVFLPIATRLAQPTLSRSERIALLLLLSFAVFTIKLLYSPTSFAEFDEFLHWVTANSILERHRLFVENPLLPVSPIYPGLEIMTTALANLTGLSVFPAAAIILCVLRIVFVSALFSLFERISGSPRIATTASLIYMGNSGFVSFDASFAYESLAVVLLVLALLAESVAGDEPGRRRRLMLALVLPLFAALAVTHHMSAFVAALIFTLLAVLSLIRPNASADPATTVLVAAMAVAMPVMWSWLMGNPVVDYLGPVLEGGMRELVGMLHGSEHREFFVAKDGSQTPFVLQLITIGSTAIVSAGLATGFFRALAMSAADRGRPVGWAALAATLSGHWRNTRMVLITLLALGFPLSIVLRLTSAGWEIGNRMGPFVFFGVALVVAVAIVRFWTGPTMPSWKAVPVGLALTAIFLGGMISGWGPSSVRSSYRVSADAASVEPTGVDAALWSRRWLGEGNRFATDRINRVLAATYGRQDVVTTLFDRIDTSQVFLSETLSPDSLAAIKDGGVDFLLVDMRLTRGLPYVGYDYEEDETLPDGGPPDPRALLKFNHQNRVSRVFDDGWIIIFDVRALRDAQ